MYFDDYQAEAIKTDIFEDDRDCVLGFCSEAGELAEKVSKAYRDGRGRDELCCSQALAHEIGDCLWYLAAICERYGLSLAGVAEGNIAKLRDRHARGVIGGSGDNR